MEPQISDTKPKPMRYAGFLSFLEKFIFVPNQSNQVWRLRLLIMAVAVGILFYPDDLREAKRIQGPLDYSHFNDFCYSKPPASLKVNFSGFNNHRISLPGYEYDPMSDCQISKKKKYHPNKVEYVYITMLRPNQSDLVRRLLWSDFSEPGFTESDPFFDDSDPFFDVFDDSDEVKYESNEVKYESKKFKYDSFKYESKKFKYESKQEDFSEEVFSEDSSASHIQVSPPSRTNHQISLPEPNTGAGESVIDIVLGPNRSDPVWQLRLLAAFSLVVHATMGVLFLPRDLQGVDATYRRVMLITNFAAPIVIAVITLLISLWVEPDREEHSNWITGLSVANFSTLGGRLAVYWAFKRET